MRRVLRNTALIAAWGILSACSHNEEQRQQAIARVSAPFAAHAITATLRAEPALNATNGIANSCTVLIIQAANKTALEQLLTNTVKLKALFAGAGAEEAILQIDRYVMMPGQENILHIDRAENTREVALVAGYFPFPTAKHIARFAIPVVTYEEGWWSKEWKAEAGPLSINVTLGSESIVSSQKVNADTVQPAQQGR